MQEPDSQFSLFNAADEWIAPFLGQQAFDAAFLLNILFQDKLVIHESYFFNSSLLAAHISPHLPGDSLFERAAREGLIIPATRLLENQATDLARVFAIQQRAYSDLGYKLVTPQLAAVRQRVVASIDEGLAQRSVPLFRWPAPDEPGRNVGLAYSRFLERLESNDGIHRICDESTSLHGARASERIRLFERVWQVSDGWRQSIIQRARDATERNGNDGVQRMEMLRSIAHTFDMESPEPIHIVDVHRTLRSNDEQALAFEVLMKWFAQAFHFVQGQAFRTNPDIPVYSLDDSFILDSIFASGEERDGTAIELNSELPSLKAMLSVGAEEILQIRNDHGFAFRHALAQWRLSPNDDSRQAVEASLAGYCRAIMHHVGDGRDTTELHATMTRSADVRAAGKSGIDVMRMALPDIGAIQTLTRFGNSLFRLVKKKPQPQRLRRQVEIALDHEVIF